MWKVHVLEWMKYSNVLGPSDPSVTTWRLSLSHLVCWRICVAASTAWGSKCFLSYSGSRVQRMDGWTLRSPTPQPPELFQKREFSESHMKNYTAVCEPSPMWHVFSLWLVLIHTHHTWSCLNMPDRCQLLPCPLWSHNVCAQACCLLMLPVIFISKMSEM